MAWKRQTEFINKWMGELEMLQYDFGLDERVMDHTRRLLIQTVNDGFTKGHKGSAIALACFYVACKLSGEYVPLNRVLKVPLGHGISRTEIQSTVRSVVAELAIPPENLSLDSRQYLLGILRLLEKESPLISPEFRSELGERALSLLNTPSARGRGGNPAILATACIYIASDQMGRRMPERSLARVAGCSEIGLRQCLRGLAQ